MFKNYFFLGLTVAAFSSIGALAYATFYNKTLFDFSLVVGNVAIVSTCVLVSFIAAFGCWFATKNVKKWGEFLFNLIFSSVTMFSILFTLKFQIPPTVLKEITAINFEGVEMFFPIYVIPMHFVPLLTWFTFKPLFFKNI